MQLTWNHLVSVSLYLVYPVCIQWLTKETGHGCESSLRRNGYATSNGYVPLFAQECICQFGRWQLKRERDEVGGVFSLVWQSFPEGWKIIHDQTSAVEPPKTKP